MDTILSLTAGGSNRRRGSEHPVPPHFNCWCTAAALFVSLSLKSHLIAEMAVYRHGSCGGSGGCLVC